MKTRGKHGTSPDATRPRAPVPQKSPGPRPALRSKRHQSREPRWRAWSNDGATVLAIGASFEAARDAARALGEADPIVEPVPHRARLA